MIYRAVLTLAAVLASGCCLTEPEISVRFTDPRNQCTKVVFPEPWGEMPRMGKIRFRRGDFAEGRVLLVAQQFQDATVMSRKKYKIPLDDLARVMRASDREWALGVDESEWWREHSVWTAQAVATSRGEQPNFWGGKRSYKGDFVFGARKNTGGNYRTLFVGTYCGFSMADRKSLQWVDKDVVALYPGQEAVDFVVVCRLDRLKE